MPDSPLSWVPALPAASTACFLEWNVASGGMRIGIHSQSPILLRNPCLQFRIETLFVLLQLHSKRIAGVEVVGFSFCHDCAGF